MRSNRAYSSSSRWHPTRRPRPERLDVRSEALLALCYREDSEFLERPLPRIWRRTGWIGDKYSIHDEGRYQDRWENNYEDVLLSVTIEDLNLCPPDDGQGYKSDEVDKDEHRG